MYIQNRVNFTLDDMLGEFNFSKRKAQMILKELRETSKKFGFNIETKRGEGYSYNIIDEELHKSFLTQLETINSGEYDNQEKRIWMIISLLMFNNNFLSIQDVSTVIDVSRTTIIRDLESVRVILKKYHLELDSVQYKGIKAVGEELNKRQLFMVAAKKISDENFLYKDYVLFVDNMNHYEISQVLQDIFNENDITFSDSAYTSIIEHLQILLYRVSKRNYIENFLFDKEKIIPKYKKAAQGIIYQLGKIYKVEIPQSEIDFLMVQLLGKSTMEKIPISEFQNMRKQLVETLNSLDKEFGTNLSLDSILEESLLFHIYPMEMRLSYGMRLESTIIDFISVEYTNSFLIALRFLEIYMRLKEFRFSRDEIGYLTIHFAAHFDRQNEKLRHTIQTILILSNSQRSNGIYTKQKLQKLFPKSYIVIRSPNELKQVIFNDIDIIFTSDSLENNPENTIVFEISELVTDREIDHIRGTLSTHVMLKRWSLRLQDLFSKELFFIEREEEDYLKILEKYSQKFVELGYATTDFPKSIIKRERAFTTIYDEAVAGPHSMGHTAIIDSVGIIILEKPCFYEHKAVSIIVMINVKKGHIFLYQSISDFILKIIDNEELRLQVLQASEYRKFLNLIKELV